MSDEQQTELRAITLYQPWATLMQIGAKTYETRSWPCPKETIGKLVCIHAGKAVNETGEQLIWRDPDIFEALSKSGWIRSAGLPRGKIVAIGPIVDAYRICKDDDDGALYMRSIVNGAIRNVPYAQTPFGDFSVGRYAWEFGQILQLSWYIPIRGMQGLWRLPADAVLMVKQDLEHMAYHMAYPHVAARIKTVEIEGQKPRLEEMFP